MVILGLVLILGGTVAILAAVFTASGSTQLVGLDLKALTIYFVGVGSAVAIMWGWSLFTHGTKRSLKQRKERRHLAELSEKLERVESERRAEAAPEADSDE